MSVEPIPPGFGAVTPHLVVPDSAEAIAFYEKAFGAQELFRMPTPDGSKIMHAQIVIGGAPIMLADEFPGMGCQSPGALGGTPITVHLYVPDADQVFAQAVAAGAKPTMPVTDMFWGDRYGRVEDPFGHSWSIATHTKDMTPEEIAEGAKAAFAQ
ncbi:MAG: VOC family protein [Pseudomonadota bacterium]